MAINPQSKITFPLAQGSASISTGIRQLIYILFFLSGASALIYQVVWVRMFGLVFGVTIFAVSTVLTAFMAGLALGSVYFGRLIDRDKDPLLVFAYLELGIGLFALLLPLFLKGLTYIYVNMHQHMPDSFYLRSLIRFVFSFLLLLIPTTLMGGTLPVLSKFFVRRLKKVGRDIGNLYSVNNLGAVVGCFAVGFFLIRTVGVRATINIAALINLLIAGVVFMARGYLKGNETVVESEDKDEITTVKEGGGLGESEGQKYPKYIVNLVLVVFAIEGFCALAYEVIWARILIAIADEKSVYFFSTVVITFIFGLSLGSFIVAKFIDYKKNLLALLGFIEIAIGVLGVWLLPVFGRLPGLLARSIPMPEASWWLYPGKEYFIFFLVMLVPTTLMGTTLPIVSKIYTTNLKGLGSRIGNIGCFDTIGSIFGSFVAGFIFIPFIGVAKAVILTSFINLSLGALLIFLHPFMKYGAKLATALILVFVIIGTSNFIDPSGKDLRYWQTKAPGDKLLYYKEGVSATVVVPHSSFYGMKQLAINGAVTAFAAYTDLRVHKMLGYLPFLLHKEPKSALIIGLGMGVTAQSLIQPGIDEVDCVEICPEVVEAARNCFSNENRNVLDEPKINLIIEDGRNHLLTTNKKYDIITSNAIHVRYSSNLYTKEFYQLCKKKLTKDGIMCQWLPTNWLSQREYQMLLKSFMEVFTHTSLWCVNPDHTILLGAPSKPQIDYRNLLEKLKAQKSKQDLSAVHLDDPFTFFTQLVGNKEDLADYVEGIPPHTDDRPYVEFSRVVDKSFNKSVLGKITEMRIDQTIIFCKKVLEIDPYRLEALVRLGIAYNNKGMPDQALIELQKAVKLDPEAPATHYHIAAAYAGKGMYNEAIAELEEIIKLEPDFLEARYNLARLYREIGRYQEAEIQLKEILRINPQFQPARSTLEELKRR